MKDFINEPARIVDDKRTLEPIAIVGIGCRFPGGVTDVASFWRLLRGRVDAVIDIPKDRLDVRRFYDRNQDKPEKIVTRQGGFIDQSPEMFDPLFFGISPREAESLDPQQRLLLEVAWEAIDDAGIPLETIKGTPVGVFVGGFCLDSMMMQFDSCNRHLINSHTSTGTALTMLANRISYTFDFRGPSVSMDTACSSSLVTCHYACESLWSGQSTIAFAGGVNMMTRPEFPMVMTKGRFLSPTNRCRAFSEGADGYVRGEGAALLVLKPLSKAIEDGDRIYSLIRASGTNQDGRTASLTSPNSDAQRELIHDVIQRARIHPTDISYIEAHGTGTQAGDTAEIAALDSVLSPGRPPDQPCVVGSVKTNIGHLEAAAGAAGLIKAALCLHYREIPPNLHFDIPNPAIDWEKVGLRIPTTIEELPKSEANIPIHAGVNSFGYGGTNAHVVLESAPHRKASRRRASQTKRTIRLVPISARGKSAVQSRCQQIFDQLLTESDRDSVLDDWTHTLACRRTHHSHRIAIPARNLPELKQGLRSILNGAGPPFLSAASGEGSTSSIVFVYSGMGPQWWRMGRDLFECEPVYRRKMRQIDRIFHTLSGWSLIAELSSTEAKSRIHEITVAQPANFAVQIALTELWKSWGITPSAVVGHSVGEVAAAHVAGCLSLRDALLVSYHRSCLQSSIDGNGAMIAVSGACAQINFIIRDPAKLSIAAINSPCSITLAGEPAAIAHEQVRFESDGMLVRRLRVSVAYHSSQMDRLRNRFIARIGSVRPSVPKIPIYSTVTGERLTDVTHDSEYWWANVREPVQFRRAVVSAVKDGSVDFLEIGPHPVLTPSIKESLASDGANPVVYPSLRRGVSDFETAINSLGQMYCRGHCINWPALTGPSKRELKSLPPYPWQRERHWLESEASRQDRLGGSGPIFVSNEKSGAEPTWEVEINPSYFPFLNDHRIGKNIVFPATAYIEAGLAVHHRIFGTSSCSIENVQLQEMLVIDSAVVQHIQVQYHRVSRQYSIHTRRSDDRSTWTPVCTARMYGNVIGEPRMFSRDLELFKSISVERCYEQHQRAGMDYGSRFRCIEQLWSHHNEVVARIRSTSRPTDRESEFIFDPVVLDAGLQSLIGIEMAATVVPSGPMIPISIERVRVHRGVESDGLWCHGIVHSRSSDHLCGDLVFFNDDNQVIAEIFGLLCTSLAAAAISGRKGIKEHLYQIRWEKAEQAKVAVTLNDEPWLIFCPNRQVERDLRESAPACAASMIFVHCAREFRRVSEHSFLVNPGNSQQIRRLFRYKAVSRCHSILFAWCSDAIERRSGFSQIDPWSPLLSLAQAMRSKELPYRLAVVTCNAQSILTSDDVAGIRSASVWGMVRVIQNEYSDIHTQLIDVENFRKTGGIRYILQEISVAASDQEIGYRGKQRWLNRLARIQSDEETDAAKTATRSTKQPLVLGKRPCNPIEPWAFEATTRRKPKRHEIEIRVHSTAVNFKDMLKGYGRLPRLVSQDTFSESSIGMECSGTVIRVGADVTEFAVEDQVVAIIPGAFRSFATVPSDSVISKPVNTNMSEAPVMIGFVTAVYSLVEMAHLENGENVLIHNASGGVGLAAIQVAKKCGATIFATAGDERKRQTIRELGVQHVYDSRTLEFANQILADTDGRGVDVVLGAMSGDAFYQSFSLLAPYGRYLEIGKKEIATDSNLPMRAFNQNVSFFGIDIDRLLKDRPEKVREILHSITNDFNTGCYQPIPVEVFPARELHQAFRHMARSQHIGKIIIQIEDQEVPIVKPDGSKLPIKRAGTYLVTGGTRGVGLLVSQWLARKGAGEVVMMSRSGAASELTPAVLDEMRSHGATPRVMKIDVSNERSVRKFFTELHNSQSELRGIVHCAMVLDDGRIDDLDQERFQRVLAPKVNGIQLLHKFSQPAELDFFISFSSISSLIGSPGQANYAAANAYLDSFSHYRRSLGFPATTINWGTIASSGIVARNGAIRAHLERIGIRSITPQDVQDVIEFALVHDSTQIGAFDVDWTRCAPPNGNGKPYSLFGELVLAKNGSANGESKILRSLQSCDPKSRQDRVEHQVRRQCSVIMRIPEGQIDCYTKLEQLGVDSLMAAELRLVLIKDFAIDISAAELLDNATVSNLSARVLAKLNGRLESGDLVTTSHPPLNGKTPDTEAVISSSKEVVSEAGETGVESSNQASSPNTFAEYPPYLRLREQMTELVQRAEQMGIKNPENPYFRTHDGVIADTTKISGNDYINYASYNYLGLSGHSSVNRAAQEAIQTYGTSVSASRMVSGERSIHRDLERGIADLLGTESAIVFVSGHATNVTVIGHMFGPEDLICHDAKIHDSVVQGSLLSGARRMVFPHNDWQALDSILSTHRDQYKRVLIAVEGIYSMDGDIPHVPSVIGLKHKHDAHLLIDEAHSLGVLGDRGFGIREHFGIQAADVDFWMGTLSKSLASCGGYIAGGNELVEYLRYTAPGFRYSVGLSPADTAAALASIAVLRAEPERVTKLQENSAYFLALAKDAGLNVGNSGGTPVIPIILGESMKCLKLSDRLFKRDINVQAILYPVVTENTERLRFFITSLHRKDQIERTIEILCAEIKRL